MQQNDRRTAPAILEFYQDLGIKQLYRKSAPPESAAVPVTAAASRPAPVVLPLAPEHDTLAKIIQDIGDCKRCRLHEGRNKIVFGTGNEQAKLVFVGEGPGADEDAQGLPFVGRAGQLLTQMIEGTAKKEGIPLLAQRRLHLQRRQVPPARESHAATGRNGNMRPVSIPPA